jgi:hypothetical protein
MPAATMSVLVTTFATIPAVKLTVQNPLSSRQKG